MQDFDFEALFRAFVIGFSVTLIAGYVVYLATRNRTGASEAKGRLILALIGIFLLASMATYYLWPSLPRVPLLDGKSLAEAEKLLKNRKLVADPRRRLSTDVAPGLVIPHSQDPAAGLAVYPGTVVSFGVNESRQTTATQNGYGAARVSLFQPRSQERLRCAPDGSGIYRCPTLGNSSGIQGGHLHLLLWVEPVSPPSDTFGWYLQRLGNGISRIETDGSWAGVIQLGNAQYPPGTGDIINVAVSIVDDDAFHELMGRGGVVIEAHPVGSNVDTASHVVITVN
jgi:PASTA domain